MSQQDLDKWNQRYAENTHRKTNPVTLLEDWLPRLPKGRALDVACGAGRNSLFLAKAGYRVDAIDISPEGLKIASQNATEQNLDINWITHDFDQPYAFDTNYDLIVVMWYVNLPLIRQLCDCLTPGGVILCEEHLVSPQEVIGPGNPQFRVQPGTLRNAVESLDVLYYEEVVEEIEQSGKLASARVVAKNTKS